MKKTIKALSCGLLAIAMAALAGCGSTVDSRDDPLSGYSVNALLPFPSRDPSLAESDPTPTPGATVGTGTIDAVTQPWQNDNQAVSAAAPTPTAKPVAVSTYTPAPTASYARLEPGDENDDVMRLQNRLIELGYLYGTADGRYGTQTQNAVRLFQKALGISQTGIANISLQERLFASNAPAYTPSAATPIPGRDDSVTSVATYATLVRGDSGDAVATLQRRLQELGYLSDTADGKFGGQTEAAVRAFQARIGLTQSGVASSSLQERLYASDAPHAPAATAAPTVRPTALPTVRPTVAPTAAPTPAANTSGYTDLTYGMKNSLAVQQMQNRLKELGYFDATATGNYYAQTAEAVRAFQTAAGLNPTGTATAETLARLYAANAPARFTAATATPAPTVSGYVTLYAGARGDEVVNLQKRLIALGWASGSADGIYGKQTVNAVKAFQAAVGYEQTGTATIELQTLLFSAIAPSNTQATAAPNAPSQSATLQPAAPSQYTLLQPGNTGDAVKRLQTRLKELGFFNGQIGGNYLTKTESAVKLFEAAIGWPETGVATVELQTILFSASAPTYGGISSGYTALEKGDSGSQVGNMQARLIELGWLSGKADGDYGNDTKKAVAAFQAAAGLSATGSASVDTLTLLYSKIAPYAPASTVAPTIAPTVAPAQASSQIFGYTALQPGDSGELVANMQARLKELGYFTGNVAGNYKDLTTEAVKRFQAALGYNQDGIASSELLSALYSNNAPYYSAAQNGYIELSKGSSGTAVYTLQQRLIALGWLSGKADGSFGGNTQNALVAFQSAAGLVATGVADALTQQYLYSNDAPVYTAPAATNAPAGSSTGYASNGYQALYPNDTGDLVKAMQRRLKELGYFDGEIGGNYLKKTTAAVEKFQAAVGYPVDGIASSELLALLYSSSAPAYGQAQSGTTGYNTDNLTVLSPGSKGSDVKRLQQRLIDLGWLTGKADGEYGGDTANAVRAFQYQIAQNEDGVANIELQQRLFAADARPYTEYFDLEEGAVGQDVLDIQLRLIDLGYLRNTEANTDGEYGPMLASAVSLLKTQMGLAPEKIDGRADIEFQKFLFSDYALKYRMIG